MESQFMTFYPLFTISSGLRRRRRKHKSTAVFFENEKKIFFFLIQRVLRHGKHPPKIYHCICSMSKNRYSFCKCSTSAVYTIIFFTKHVFSYTSNYWNHSKYNIAICRTVLIFHEWSIPFACTVPKYFLVIIISPKLTYR